MPSWLDGAELAIPPASSSDSSVMAGQEPEKVESCCIASSVSSAPSRAQSSVKTPADPRTAEWLTDIYTVDGNEAESVE